jgi:hypothetical protein
VVIGRHIPVDELKVVKSDGKALPKAFVIEDILDHRETIHGMEYLVKWKDLDEDEQSWEPAEHFNDWAVLRKYWQKAGNVSAGPGVLDQVIDKSRGPVRKSERIKNQGK